MYQPRNPNVLSTGTTTVGMVVKDAVVVATDTRVTAGFFVAHRRGKKVFPLAQHAAITIAGRVADAQSLIDILKANINYYQIIREMPMPINAVARLTSNIMFSSRYFPYYAQLILAGVDNEGPHLFNLDPFGSVTEEKLIATGSGSPVAYGVLE
ncbi:MAG: proteasome subunit beta, partial [Candidatus Caldarchaeum sp.]